MDLHLNGKVVVVTGGSQGIGKQVLKEFAAEGCIIATCARRADKLEAAVQEFAENGTALYAESVDVTDFYALEKFAQNVVDRYGRIDVWVNNAGHNHFQMLIDYSPEEFDDIVAINFKSIVYGAIIAARQMRKTGGGVILNASSYASITPMGGKIPYGACKAAVRNITQSMAGEWAPYKIRVNCYIPGMIATEMTKPNFEKMGDKLRQDIAMQRIGEPEDVGKTLVFLASDAASYINGTAIEITGGKRVIQNPTYPFEVAAAENR